MAERYLQATRIRHDAHRVKKCTRREAWSTESSVRMVVYSTGLTRDFAFGCISRDAFDVDGVRSVLGNAENVLAEHRLNMLNDSLLQRLLFVLVIIYCGSGLLVVVRRVACRRASPGATCRALTIVGRGTSRTTVLQQLGATVAAVARVRIGAAAIATFGGAARGLLLDV